MSPKTPIEKRLQSFPELQARMEHILDIAENKGGQLVRADDVEDRVTEEIQKLAREVIRGWAEKESQRQAEHFECNDQRHHKHGKKNSIGKQNMEESAL